MAGAVVVRQIRPDLWTIAPAGAPLTTDPDPGVDTAVLEVRGGHLSWTVPDDPWIPAATLHDLDAAQEWLWAVYGAGVAVAADEYTGPVELPVRPERPELAAAVRRLGYAHWAARWWPASTVDGIAALDSEVLEQEIAELTELCEGIVDGADAVAATESPSPDTAPPGPAVTPGDRISARAGDYALAAGGPARNGALSLGRGSGGWDWRLCPAGVLDASEHAVSWELFRTAGATTARIAALAAPGAPAAVPDHLRPFARLRTPLGPVEIALEPGADSWLGEVAVPADTVTAVEIFVPGVGPEELSGPAGNVTAPADSAPGSAEERAVRARKRIRDLARTRLRWAGAHTGPGPGTPGGRNGSGAPDPESATTAPLRAETAAAESDSDF
ncbi:hypothetical protein [Nocardia sp. NPDC024068]|uniref:hypothetical protein n=1 Tax=Nocardia sp. NPDC024068 TaxID=3157197 RepID=UPI0033EACC0E